ncbi:hypothetical protein LQ564_07965 [Massilia sp. G4R7]|uniref:Immunity protein 10 of polymorphic toxin system n=1 Tax=Massilia phyllostachyos TaxID=2898585 RepID=A0ABS8Q3D1_9BURK|nr:Imm10 family immunity protein [Massilia phyllostachyos]MCD2516251.1 hypothetical protein [Massilia phyllostachyos]
MNYELFATFVSLEENDGNLVFAFSDDECGAGKYVMFQCSTMSGEGDFPLDADGLYIECDDQSTACYRGVASIRRVGERMEIDLTEQGRQHLGVEQILIMPLPWTATISDGLARLADLSRGDYTVDR